MIAGIINIAAPKEDVVFVHRRPTRSTEILLDYYNEYENLVFVVPGATKKMKAYLESFQ